MLKKREDMHLREGWWLYSTWRVMLIFNVKRDVYLKNFHNIHSLGLLHHLHNFVWSLLFAS
jgi:hypothetical protein